MFTNRLFKSFVLFVFVLGLIFVISPQTAYSSNAILIGENRQGHYVPANGLSNYEYDLDLVYEANGNDILLKQVFIQHFNDTIAVASPYCNAIVTVTATDTQGVDHNFTEISHYWFGWAEVEDVLILPNILIEYPALVTVGFNFGCLDVDPEGFDYDSPIPQEFYVGNSEFEIFEIDPCNLGMGTSVVGFFAHDTCLGDSSKVLTSASINASDVPFEISSVFVASGWSAFLTNGQGDYLCTDHSLWDLDQDYYNPNPNMPISGNISYMITYNDSTCGGADTNQDGTIETFSEPQSAVVNLVTTGGGGGTTTGHVEIFQSTNFGGTKLGDYLVGTHNFSVNTLMYSFRMQDGVSSFVVIDDTGNDQCFDSDVPNMQDNSDFWNKTVEVEVFTSNVCGSINGEVTIYSATNYTGSVVGTYTAGNTYTFPVDTLMFSFDTNGAGSYVVTAPDGRRQCFNSDVPNMQDHSEYWRETVKLEVNSNDLCPPSGSPAPAVGTGTGLWRNQFRILWEEVDIPNLSVIAPMQWGPVTSVSVNDAACEDQLGMRFEGCINLPQEDTYIFYLTSDDGSVLYIDDYAIVDNNGLHSATEESGTINKLAGQYNFKLDYFENDGGQTLGLQVSSSTMSKQIVPEVWYSYGNVCSGAEATTTDPLTTNSQMVTVEPLQSQAVITLSNVVTQAVSLLSSGVDTTNLVGYWDFNATSGTTFSDQIGTNHLAATSSNVVGNAGVFGNGLTADGTDYASVANMSGELKPADGDDFSVSFWIDNGQTSSGTDYYFLSNFNTNSNDSGWWLVMNKTTGGLTYFYGKNAPGMNHATGLDITGLLDGNRHHVAITLSGMNYGNNIRSYKDGVLVDDKTISGGDSIVYNSSNTLFVSRSTIATIDDLAIFEQILSSSQVQEIAQGSTQTGYENSIRFTSDVAGMNELTFAVSSIDYVSDVATVTVDKGSLDEIYVWHQNSSMVVGDPPSQPAGIAANWSYNQELTINANEVVTDMVNFPVLISNGVFSSSVYANAKTNGADLRFTSDSAGTNELSFQMVSWDSVNEESEVWVLLPNVSSSTNTSLYAWYGNASATAYADSDEFGALAVWNSYTQVLHLDESANNSAGGYEDSSGNHSATGVSMSVNSTSHIGNGLHLDGGSDYLNIVDNADFEIAQGSFSFWFVPDVAINTSSPAIQYLMDKGNTYLGARIRGGGSNAGALQLIMWDGAGHYITTSQNAWNAGQSYYLTLTWGAGGMNLYIDGVVAGTNSHTGGFSNVGDNINLGRNTNNQYYFDGELDEWRWSATQHSDEWIQTEYNNQSSPTTFFVP